MPLTARQANVLANIDRVLSDGARCDTRYELDGVNVSQQMRALIAQGLVDVDHVGALSKRENLPNALRGISPVAEVADEMRALLLAQPAPKPEARRRVIRSSK